MYLITVEFRVAEAHLPEFMEAILQQARNSLDLEPGCHRFDVSVAEEKDNVIFLYEIYSDRQAFDQHLGSAHFAKFDATVSGWIEDKQVKSWNIQS